MKNNMKLVLGLGGFLLSSLVNADGILAQSTSTAWRPVVGLGGGVAIPDHLGQSAMVPIVDPLTDIYFVYSPQGGTSTQAMFEGFLGAERRFSPTFIFQGGLAYTRAAAYSVKGSLVQGADPTSDDRFTYQYQVVTQQLLAQAKLMYPYHDKIYPYALLGLGASFNTANNFSTSVPTSLSATRAYAG